jgi:pimeloyl-ACP methyl ester carboxylesterase
MARSLSRSLVAVGVVVAAAAGTWGNHVAIPAWGANALLHPGRRILEPAVAARYETVRFTGDGVDLEGWRVPALGPRRGTVVYLHGVADNRGSALGAVRLTRRGFDLVAYDSRGHGGSGGDACTYGFYERRDLRKVIDTLPAEAVVLMGTSLGGAIALQAAAEDSRIRAVVALESFSDLATVAAERAPAVMTRGAIRRALAIAERIGRFQVAEVSPADAARRLTIPVLLVHGESDRETPPSHSERIFEALAGPKRLLLVPAAGHNQSLNASTWAEVERWIDESLR